MKNRYLRLVSKRDKTKKNLNLYGLYVLREVSVSELASIGLLFSYLVSFLWNFIFFYHIRTIPAISDGMSLWFFIGIVVLGVYSVIVMFSMFLIPASRLGGVKFSQEKFWNRMGHVLLVIAPYFIIYVICASISEIKIAIMLLYYSLSVFFVLVMYKTFFVKIKSIGLFLFWSFLANVFAIFIFDISVVKEKRNVTFIIIVLAIILFAQILYYLIKKRNPRHPLIAPIFTFFFLVFVFNYSMPALKDGYRFQEMLLILPYNIFHVGYYHADIVVNKDSYNMIMSIRDNSKSDDNKNYKIKNAYILFSMGDEYIIQTCVEKISENRNDLWLGEKAKYRYHIVKASRNSEILPSSYTYEKYDWESLHKNDSVCACSDIIQGGAVKPTIQQ